MFYLFIIIPVIEVYLIYKMVSEIGFLYTFTYFIFSIFLGSSLIKRSGSNIFHLASGVLFLVPGLLSDIFALLLLTPGLNYFFKKIVTKTFAGSMGQNGGRVHFKFGNMRGYRFDEAGVQNQTIDVTPRDVTHTADPIVLSEINKSEAVVEVMSPGNNSGSDVEVIDVTSISMVDSKNINKGTYEQGL